MYMFGILISNVHMAWMRAVAGRLEMRYSYSPAVYNNFPWPTPTDEQKAKMFDGKLDEQCWYASSQSFSWGYGGNFIIGLDKTYDVSGFRWHYYYEDSNPQITDVRYSEDGKNWTSLSNQVAFVPKVTDQWKIFQFKEAVKARYIRVYVGNVSGFTSMNEAEIHTPAN